MINPTIEELAIFDEIGRLGSRLWGISTQIEGFSTDPKMISIMLFKRLWSNHRGYTALYRHGLLLEANIILRSAVEAAICIAANSRLGHEFAIMIKQDACHTIQGQIKLHRNNEAVDLVRDAEATLRYLQSLLPEGSKAAKLNWENLADKGGVHQLYDFHRMLSGISSHVTGLSILRGVSNGRVDAEMAELAGLERKMYLMMMAGAMLQGARIHAGMVDAVPELTHAIELTERLASLSAKWPGAANQE